MMFFVFRGAKLHFFSDVLKNICTFAAETIKNIMMVKYTGLFAAAIVTLFLVGCNKDNTNPNETPANSGQTSNTPEIVNPEDTVTFDRIYQFKVLNGQGDSVSLANYRGQVLLVVNTATECGFTPQYTDLERMYQSYRNQGFTILDFPCNQFGGQAPGTYEEIHGYCTGTYNITFPQFAKIDVNGTNASPLYLWLKSKKPGNIPWNFTKFIINRKGEVVGRFDARTSDMSDVQNAVINQL